MSDAHQVDFNNHRAPSPGALGSMGPTAAETQEEEREPGALAPRQLPGDDLSETAGASRALATSSVDFGFGNSWSHIPIPVGDHFDGHHHQHPPHHDGEGPHEPQGDGSASAGKERPSRGAGRHSSDDDKVMSDSHPAAVSVAAAHGSRNSPTASSEETQQSAALAAGGLEPTLGYAHDVSSTNSLAEAELGEIFHAHSSSVSGRSGVDNARGSSSAPPAGEGGRATPSTEPVSLPDDIYGAARVSEYWHGVPGLSSLASTYVYDDIWAGDGGLNPREDIMSITGCAAGGGHAATQERGGGGEAVAEVFGVGSRTGAQQSQAAQSSPARHGSVSGGGDYERRAGSKMRGRAEDGNSSSGSSRRRRRGQPGVSATGGGVHEDGSNARGSSEESIGKLGWDESSSRGMGGGRAHRSGGADCRFEEGHASKKRRTPSPDAERRSAASGTGSADATSREQQALQEAEVIRWCQKVSRPRAMSEAAASGGDGGGGGSGSNGDEERFFAGRVLDPAPRPPPRRHSELGSRDTRSASINNEGLGGWGGGWMMGEVSPTTPSEFVVQHNGGGGKEMGKGDGDGNGVAGGGFHGDPSRRSDQATAAVAQEARAALPAASSGCGSRSQSGAEIAAALSSASSSAAATATISETAAALGNEATREGAAGAAGQGSSSSSSSSDAKKEAFFASHTLEPKPRSGVVVAPLAAQGGPREAGKYHHSFGDSGVAGSAAESLSLPPGSSGVTGSHRLSVREEEVLAAAAAAKAAAATEAESSSSMDWQVRPEAMMGFFTTVGGAYPPSLLRPGRRHTSGVWARSPSPRRGKQYTARGGEPNPSGVSSSGSGGGGGSPAAPAAAAGGGVDAAVAAAAAREWAAKMVQDAKLTSDLCTASTSSNGWNSWSVWEGGDAEGGEGDGNSSWGW